METQRRTTVDNDPKAGEWDLTTRPPTPWGARYGVHSQGPGPFLHTNRSWLSPSFPTFDPIDIPNIRGYIPEGTSGDIEAPKGEEADRLFTSESIQLQRFGGLRTWEAVLLKDVASYEAGNEIVLPGNEEGQRIVVREDKWFLAFKKNRWIDYNVRLRDSDIDFPRAYGGVDGIWSVDNPVVWEELRPSIELANRILRLACHGPWLSSIVDSSAHETTYGIRYALNKDTGDVSASTDAEPYRRFVEVNPHRRLSPECVAAFIDTIDYHFSWSFFDPSHELPTPESFRGQTMCIVDCPALKQGGSSQMLISIDISAIKALFSWNVTDVERSIIQHTIGINMVLAFVDALARNRGLAYLEEEAKTDPRATRFRQFQLFYGEEAIADHRASFAKSVFGGKLEFPLYEGLGNPNKTGFVLPTTAREFPIQAEALQQLAAVGEITGPLALKLYPAWLHRHIVWPIPCIWQASMMNENFWIYDVQRFGIQALKFPKYLFCEDMFHLGWSMSAFRTTQACWAMDTISFPENSSGRHLVRQLEQRRRLWSRFREKWYADMHRNWELPPYSNIIFREELRLITEEYFLRRHAYDEFRAHEIAQRWIIMPYFIASEVVVPTIFYTNALLCRAVGLIIMAALPARLKPKTCQRSGWIWPDATRQLWKLSEAAKASNDGKPIRVMEHWWADRKAPEFVLPQRHHGETDAEILAMRIELLNEARNTLELYRVQDMAVPLVTRLLLLQIRHLRHLLKDVMLRNIIGSANNNEGKTIPVDGAGRWLDIFFKIPKYSHENQVRNPEASQERPTTKSMAMDKAYFEKLGIPQAPVSVPRVPTVDDVPNPGKKLWTVGQVADQFRNGRFWALVREGARYAVHDVTDAMSGFSFPWPGSKADFSYCRYGRVLKGESIGSAFSPSKAEKIHHKGYLIQEFSAEEVAEARTSTRSWTRLGDDVYDITVVLNPRSNVQLSGEERIALAQSRGRNAIVALQNRGLESHLQGLREKLQGYKIGRVRRRTPSSEDGPAYSADDVTWFTSRRTGKYTVLRGVMYDLTDFIDWHPGGSSILEEYAVGRDCTELFNRAHTEPDKVLNTIKHLVVAKTVPRRENTILARNEFVINEHVYKLDVSEEDMLDLRLPHHRLYSKIAFMDRANLSLSVRGGHEDAMALARRSELIVGKLKPVMPPPQVDDRDDEEADSVEQPVLTSWLPGVRGSDLARCNGLHADTGYYEGWICVDDVIYNITTLVRYGHRNLREGLDKLSGRTIERTDIPQDILPYLEGRAIARLDEAAPQWDKENNFITHANEGTKHTPKITRFAPHPKADFEYITGLPTPKSHPRFSVKRLWREQRSVTPASPLARMSKNRRLSFSSKKAAPPGENVEELERAIKALLQTYSAVDRSGTVPGLSNRPLYDVIGPLTDLLRDEIAKLERIDPSKGRGWNWKCSQLVTKLAAAWEAQHRGRQVGVVNGNADMDESESNLPMSQGIAMMVQEDSESEPPASPPAETEPPNTPPSETEASEKRTTRLAIDIKARHLLHRTQLLERRIYDQELETQNDLLETLQRQKRKRRRRPKIPNVKVKPPPHMGPLVHGRRPIGPPPQTISSAEETALPPRLPDVWPYGTYSMFMPTTWNDEQAALAKKYAQGLFPGREKGETAEKGGETANASTRLKESDPTEFTQMASQVLPIMEFFNTGAGNNNWGDGYSSGEDEGILALKSLARKKREAAKRLLLPRGVKGGDGPPLGGEGPEVKGMNQVKQTHEVTNEEKNILNKVVKMMWRPDPKDQVKNIVGLTMEIGRIERLIVENEGRPAREGLESRLEVLQMRLLAAIQILRTDRQEPQTPGAGAQEAAAGPASLRLDLQATLENVAIVDNRILINTDAILESRRPPEFGAELQRQKEEYEDQLSAKQDRIDTIGMQLFFARKKTKILMDDNVQRDFARLRYSIFNFVMNTTSRSAPELQVLALRSKIATFLHSVCFSSDSMLFGYGDDLGSKNPLYIFENYLRDSDCDHKLIKQWRVVTTEAAFSVLSDNTLDGASEVVAESTLQSLCRKYGSPQLTSGIPRDLKDMCSHAIRLALDLGSTGNGYVWEQTLSPRIDGVEYNAEKDFMVGTEEPDISDDDEDLDVSLVVFGGVVRGRDSYRVVEERSC